MQPDTLWWTSQFGLHSCLSYNSHLKPDVLQVKHYKRHWVLLVTGEGIGVWRNDQVCVHVRWVGQFWIEAESVYRQQHLCVSVCVYIGVYLNRSVRVYISIGQNRLVRIYILRIYSSIYLYRTVLSTSVCVYSSNSWHTKRIITVLCAMSDADCMHKFVFVLIPIMWSREL